MLDLIKRMFKKNEYKWLSSLSSTMHHYYTFSEPSWKYSESEDWPNYQTPLLVIENCLYIRKDEHLIAIDMPSKAIKWKYTSDMGFADPMIYLNDQIYLSDGNSIYCVCAESAKEIWKNPIGTFASGMTADNSVLFVGSCNSGLYAISSITGDILWTFNDVGEIFTSPAVKGEHLFTGSLDHCMYVVDKHTGQLAWKYQTKSEISSTPVFTEELVVFGSRDRHLYAINMNTRKLSWKFHASAPIEQSPAIVNGNIYLCAGNVLYKLDLYSGKAIWTFTEKYIHDYCSTPVVIENDIFIQSRDEICVHNKETGKLLWTIGNLSHRASLKALFANNSFYYIDNEDRICAYPISEVYQELHQRLEEAKRERI